MCNWGTRTDTAWRPAAGSAPGVAASWLVTAVGGDADRSGGTAPRGRRRALQGAPIGLDH
ncbi:hypothetical protein SLNHY_0447 [Streptomyces albus]|nr:hypothetical protein SLNHY_0447 [Streptomyces albus]